MESLPNNFSFKETILVPCVVSSFFGVAAAVIALACFLKISENPIWLVPGLAAVGIVIVLFRFAINTLRYRQVITINSDMISSQCWAKGEIKILWSDVDKVSEEEIKGENLRRAMPGLETMISMYINLPLAGGTFRKSRIIIQGVGGREITLRTHMLYPHRLEQLRHAISRYAPAGGLGAKFLRLNINN